MTTLRGINSYRGVRNAQGLPVRGQSSKSNAKHNENDVVLRLPKFKILNLKKDK